MQRTMVYREITVDGLTLRLRTLRPNRRCRTLTYVQVFHDEHWLDCGDPHHGETRSRTARSALAHYARLALRTTGAADN